MLVRQARQSDASQLAELVFTSAPNLLTSVFSFTPNIRALDFLQNSLTSQDGQYGYGNHWVITIEQQLVACVCAWPSQLPASFHQATLASLLAFYSADDMLHVIQRSKVLQHCIPQPTEKEWCIGHVAVANSHQRQGLGKTLLATMQQQARSQGKSYLSLDVDCTNTAAISFYLQQGFIQQSQSTVSAKMQTLAIGQHLHMVKQLKA